VKPAASTAAAAPPSTVGLWIELDPSQPAPAACDERIRRARGLVAGLDALPGVGSILLPCLPADVAAIEAIFADAARPGRLVSDKLRVVAAGRDPTVRRAVIAWGERRRNVCLDRLAGLGATASLGSWRAAIAKLAEDPRRRAFAAPRRMIKLIKLWARLRIAEAILAAVRLLPPPQASAVADLRRRGLWARWIVFPAETAAARRLRGPKILDLGADASYPARARHLLHRLAAAAVAVVAPSRRVADAAAGALGGEACRVIPPAPLPVSPEAASEAVGRQRLADKLRELFSAGVRAPLHRHLCDFPFERADYLVAVPTGGDPGPLLAAFATVLRRHRRNLMLVIDGRLPRGDEPFDEVERLGLSFDVAEAGGLSEVGRARLLRHARAVVVADGDGGCLPAAFSEAAALGTPLVMAGSPAIGETLTADELAAAEYVDPEGGADGLVRALLHALDHRDAVLTRQRAILARLAARTWADVAAEMLGLVPPAAGRPSRSGYVRNQVVATPPPAPPITNV
jgi:glycosyltransferase involved in cell wall biosynthesis